MRNERGHPRSYLEFGPDHRDAAALCQSLAREKAWIAAAVGGPASPPASRPADRPAPAVGPVRHPTRKLIRRGRSDGVEIRVNLSQTMSFSGNIPEINRLRSRLRIFVHEW